MGIAKLLIVDDEPSIRDMLRMSLEMHNFDCVEAEDAQTAHAAILDHNPDLVLLDWMMPGASGIELVRRLKRDSMTRDLPIIMLTAKTDEDNKVHGLTVGVDDYVTKPFSIKELIARINALLRRSGLGHAEKPLQFDVLRLDPASHRVFVNDSVVDIGPTEYKLLHFFMRHPERAYSRAQLLDQVWGGNVYVEERTVDVHIRRLRKALETTGHQALSQFIQTVRGTGYRFSPNV